jgi:hypothetical protein
MVVKSVGIGLNLYGLLVSGLRGRVSNEPLIAFNAVILAHGTEHGAQNAFFGLRDVLKGSAVCFGADRSLNPNRKEGVGEVVKDLLLVPFLFALVALAGFLVIQIMFRFAA